jgi:hypothetical protein
VEHDVAANPADVGLLGPATVVSKTDLFPDAVQKARPGATGGGRLANHPRAVHAILAARLIHDG